MVDLNIELPKGFLNEEVRSGYTVLRKMKEVWAVELDLFEEFKRVCKKNNLSYCLGAGSLLGCVRDKGFIPWDDDIDIYMLREDYDKLMNCSDEFAKPYFLQNSRTEKYLFRSHAQLRNADTTGFAKCDENMKINKGIFLDIFPLDGISENKRQDERQKKKDKFLKFILGKYNRAYLSDEKEHTVKRKILRLFFLFVRKDFLCKLFENNLKKFSKENAQMWGNRTLVFDCPKSRRPIKDWKNLVEAPFEFTTALIPENYDGILRQQYGDYLKPKQISSMHGGIVSDAG